jgi:predicted transcriptional regulator
VSGAPAGTMYTSYIVHRTQIYLDDDQERQLVDRARQVGLTKSALIRDAIDAYLSPASGDDGALAGLRAAVRDAAGAAPYLPSGLDYVEEFRAADHERQLAVEQRD